MLIITILVCWYNKSTIKQRKDGWGVRPPEQLHGVTNHHPALLHCQPITGRQSPLPPLSRPLVPGRGEGGGVVTGGGRVGGQEPVWGRGDGAEDQAAHWLRSGRDQDPDWRRSGPQRRPHSGGFVSSWRVRGGRGVAGL